MPKGLSVSVSNLCMISKPAVLILLLLAVCDSFAPVVTYSFGVYSPTFRSSASHLGMDSFIGTWQHRIGDVKRLTISRRGSAYYVNVWAFSTRGEIEWGEVLLTPFGESVAATRGTAAIGVWNHDYASTTGLFRRMGKDLVLESFTTFADNSGRSNYWATDRLRKQKSARRKGRA